MSASPDTTRPGRTESLRLPPREQGWAGTFWVLFGVVALAGLLFACAWFTAPALISDWQVRETARSVPTARVSEGTCSAKLVIHICDMTLSLRTPAGPVSRRVNYVFSGVQIGDYSAGVMADPARPEFMTTDLGLDRLWNRTLTLLVLAGALAACIYGALRSVIRGRREAG